MLFQNVHYDRTSTAFAMTFLPYSMVRCGIYTFLVCTIQVSVEISTEPAVREHVRSLYLERAVVSTRPTPDGNDAIDTFHEYAGVKWLLNKPIIAFNDAQWLLIEKAVEEKLLEVTVGLPKEQIASLMQDCEALYLSDGVSLTAQQWNEQRKQILRDAIVSLLLPAMEKEARMLLTTRAKQWLSSQYGLQLWNKVSVAAFVPEKANDQDERCVKLLGFCTPLHILAVNF